MAGAMRTSALTRRRFLTTGASSSAIAAIGIAKPALSRAADRPLITHGIQSGDVSIDSGIVWARADRPSRMLVEVATTDSFKNVRSAVFVDALPETDFTAKALIEGLPAGQDIFYRIRFQDHSFPTLLSAPQIGRFRTAPSERRNVSFVWSGDTAGGWGIDEARGGMRTYSTMLKCRPDFFIHSGDHIYADCPIQSERKLPDGGVWKNIVTEDKSRIAQTLAEFRGNYKYNLLDKNLLAFNAEVPLLAQWDDHEVTNDWCPGEAPGWRGYVDKSILTLAARGCRAFHEFMPMRETLAEAGRIYRKVAYGPLLDIFLLDMRSYRTAYGEDESAAAILGPAQMSWLKRELMSSQATWKIIAADLPLGVVSGDAIAQGDGAPRGRECEIADLLALHQACRHSQYGLDHRRHALHRRALLRPERGGVPGLRAVLGVHLRSDPRRHLASATARQHVRPTSRFPEGMRQRPARRPGALLRAAILRSRGDRWRHRGHDRHAQGRRRPHAMVDQDRAADGEMVAWFDARAQLALWLRRSLRSLPLQDAPIAGMKARLPWTMHRCHPAVIKAE